MSAAPVVLKDARHALYVGWVFGIARRSGVDLDPVVVDGAPTDRLALRLGPPVYVDVTIVVPPPPPDWTLPELPKDPWDVS